MNQVNKILMTLFLLSIGINVNFYMVNDDLVEEVMRLEEAATIDIESRITETLNSVASLSCVDTVNYLCSQQADCTKLHLESTQYFCDTAGERL
jgi:hypothetical protein